MAWLGSLFEALLKLLTHYFAYDYGKTKSENDQLKKNDKVKGKHEEIDDMDIASNDAYAEWLRNSK